MRRQAGRFVHQNHFGGRAGGKQLWHWHVAQAVACTAHKFRFRLLSQFFAKFEHCVPEQGIHVIPGRCRHQHLLATGQEQTGRSDAHGGRLATAPVGGNHQGSSAAALAEPHQVLQQLLLFIGGLRGETGSMCRQFRPVSQA